MSMSMEREWELEDGVVGVVVDVGVGDLAEVVPVTRAGLVAPAAQAQPTQLATGACAEGRLFGVVEPLAVLAVAAELHGGGGSALAPPPLPGSAQLTLCSLTTTSSTADAGSALLVCVSLGVTLWALPKSRARGCGQAK